MKQLNKCVLFFIVLFLNTTYLFVSSQKLAHN